jgi:hypothetical protein
MEEESSVPLSELAAGKRCVDGIVKLLCVERFSEELEVTWSRSAKRS